MGLEFLAMLIVMVLLIVCTILILKSLASAAGVRIRADMARLLKAYDKVIDGKNAEIDRLNREKEVPAGQEEVPAPVLTSAGEEEETLLPPSLPKTAAYRADGFGEGYGSVRAAFRMDAQDRETLTQEILEQESGENLRGEAAAGLLNALGFETVFSLSRLQPDEQLEVLDTTLNDRDWTLLRDFCEERGEGKPFDVTAFWNWLKDVAALEGTEVSVRCGDAQVSEEENLDYRAQICEGIQIRAGGRLYDYSIQEREIS